MRTILDSAFLPDYLAPAHTLCLLNHDILVELLRSGEEHDIFSREIEFRNEAERAELAGSANIFDWLARTGRTSDRDDVLRRMVFPALLSDFLHFVFEALETSRKAKLTTTYALLRKPLYDSLFLFEMIATSVDRFGSYLTESPLKLQARTAGDRKAHGLRIAAALQLLGEEDRFDANFIAQLRYDKSSEDSFAGSCDQALHLFTEREVIRTEPLNVNFIFSNWEEKQTQWYYLYSRLPYLLFYARRLVEHICSTFAATDPAYLAEMERRVAAATLLWARNIDKTYRHATIERFVAATRSRLDKACRAAGYRKARISDLPRMMVSGAFPAGPALRKRTSRR